MTIEERIELHEQWLHSMESNQRQMAAHLEAIDRRVSQLSEIMVTFGQNLNAVTIALTSLTTRVEAIAEHQRRLEETVERYIRFRGNGRPEN